MRIAICENIFYEQIFNFINNSMLTCFQKNYQERELESKNYLFHFLPYLYYFRLFIFPYLDISLIPVFFNT
jgi:hypothetical protein